MVIIQNQKCYVKIGHNYFFYVRAQFKLSTQFLNKKIEPIVRKRPSRYHLTKSRPGSLNSDIRYRTSVLGILGYLQALTPKYANLLEKPSICNIYAIFKNDSVFLNFLISPLKHNLIIVRFINFTL